MLLISTFGMNQRISLVLTLLHQQGPFYLFGGMGKISQNRIRFGESALETTMFTTPTPLQQRALDLLQVSLNV